MFRFKRSEVVDLSDDDFKRLKVVLPHVEFASLLSSVDSESFSYIALDNLEPVRSTTVQDRVSTVLKKESFIAEVGGRMLKTPVWRGLPQSANTKQLLVIFKRESHAQTLADALDMCRDGFEEKSHFHTINYEHERDIEKEPLERSTGVITVKKNVIVL